MDEDKRYYPRSNIEFDIYIKPENGSEFLKTKGMDISATGLSFESFKYPVSFNSVNDLDVGSKVEIILDLKEIEKRIPVKAKIIRCWMYGKRKFCSVEVTEASEDDFVYMLDYSLEFLQNNSSQS